MVLDEPERPLGDGPPERLDRSPDMVLRVDGLADVVQQGGQQEFLVIRPRLAPARRPASCDTSASPSG